MNDVARTVSAIAISNSCQKKLKRNIVIEDGNLHLDTGSRKKTCVSITKSTGWLIKDQEQMPPR